MLPPPLRPSCGHATFTEMSSHPHSPCQSSHAVVDAMLAVGAGGLEAVAHAQRMRSRCAALSPLNWTAGGSGVETK